MPKAKTLDLILATKILPFFPRRHLKYFHYLIRIQIILYYRYSALQDNGVKRSLLTP